MVEDYTVEEKIPIKKDKPAPAPAATAPAAGTNVPVQPAATLPEPAIEYETKLKKKTRHTDLVLEHVSALYQHTKEGLHKLTEI